MIKKNYMKPTMKVVEIKYQSHILAGSGKSVKTSGLDDEDDLLLDDSGSDPGNAW